MSVQRSSNHRKINSDTGFTGENHYNGKTESRRDQNWSFRRTTKGKTLRSLRDPKHAAASFRRMLHQKSGASIA
jgi:hypothetical protein